MRDIAQAAFSLGVITTEEYALLKRRNHLRDIVIRVDDFPFDHFGFHQSRPVEHEQKAA